MARKQRVTPFSWQRQTGSSKRLEDVLKLHFPNALCRVFPAPDQRLRLLVIDDQFNGIEFLKKRNFVLKELTKAQKNHELQPEDMNEIGSIDAISPLELV